MTEKPTSDEIDWNNVSYSEFTEQQQKLRNNLRATIPFVEAGNYPELMKKKSLFREAGFDANEHSNGGLSIFVEDEDGFKKLQEFVKEKNLKLKMPTP